MTACMAIRKGAFFTAITAIIATCRCTFSLASSCCARGCAGRGRGRRSFCAPTRDFAREELIELVRAKWGGLCVRIGQEFAASEAHSQGAEPSPGGGIAKAARRSGGSAEFRYRTLQSWSRKRRVVAKAERLAKGDNPRFVVTSLGARRMPMRELYEDFCAAARWKIASKSSIWTCSPTAPRRRRCARIRCGCIFPRSRMACCSGCGSWAWRGPKWRGRSAERSG